MSEDQQLRAFDSMTIDEWERHKAQNWARGDALDLAPDSPNSPTRATTAAPGAIEVRPTLPLARVGADGSPGEIVGAVSWSPPPATPRVRIVDVWLPQQVDAVLYGGDRTPRVELTIEVRNGVPGYTRVEISTPAHTGRHLISRDMTVVRDQLTYWLDLIVEAVAQPTDAEPIAAPSWADRTVTRDSVSAARRPQRRQITPELLADVAALYRANITGSPIDAIKRALGCSTRTAARYVEMCRSDEYQLLPKTTRGQRKA